MTYNSPDDQQPPQQYPQYGQPGPYQQGPYQQGPYQQGQSQQSPYQQQPYPSAPPPGYGGYQQGGTNGLAIAGLVCGLVGLLIFWFVLGPLAIIFGGVALSRANRGAPRRGMAIWAIALGIADIVLYVILLAVLIHDHRFVV